MTAHAATITRIRRLALTLTLAGAAGLLGGCMVGPNFQRPAPPSVTRYTAEALPATLGSGATAQHLVAGAHVPAQWWARFGSAQLDALVAQALEANPNLETAKAALQQAQQAAAAQKSSLFPSVSADYNASRQRNAGTLASPLASNANYFTLHTAQVNIAYAPDVFGGGRRELEALQAQTDAARFQLEAARVSLAANVVVAAITEAGLHAEIAETENSIASQRKVLQSLKRQQTLGAVPQSAVVAQRAALAQAAAGLPPLRRQLGQQRDALAALLGEPPERAPTTPLRLADLHLPGRLPLSLPAQLVEQRPDVRAADAQLRAASANVGVAIADRLPKFMVNAAAGSSATGLSSLFAHGTSFWSLAADIAEPIFDAGALKHQQKAAEAAFRAAKSQYRAVVIGALQSVADTLYALQSDAASVGAAQTAARAAQRSLHITREQFALGDVDYIGVLQAEQANAQARTALIAAETARYADTAALFQALGGGWHEEVRTPNE